MQSQRGNGAVALLKALRAGGARICFANPGTTELTLVDALAEVPEIRSVLSLFEGVCTGAADGFARVSGEVPLTLLHLGPGFANGIANLHNARRAHSGIVNIIGDHAQWHLAYDAPLTSDIRSLASPVSRAVVYMDDVARIGADAASVLEAAAGAPGGPATLIVPTDIMDAKVDAPPVPVIAPARRRTVEADRIADGAQALRDASDIILLLGGDALVEAGQRAAAAIVGKVGGRVLMEPYPAIVPLGGDLPPIERQAYFPDDVLRQMGDALVVTAGARVPISYFGYEGYPSQLVPDDRLFTLSDLDEDGVAALEALAAHLDAAPGIAAPPVKPVTPPVAENTALTPMLIVESVIERLPENAIVSMEGSTLGGPWLREAHRARRHRVMTNTGGAIGQGLPCATGAALAAPGTRVVALQSDGSGHYTLQALWTMAREKLPVTIVIAANHRYGILQTELNRVDAPLEDPVIASLTRLDNPRADWTALAAGYGVEAVRVTTVGDFNAALERSLASDLPLLIQAELP
ncbi:acetolactate synthase large subunit [Sphingobium sp. HBC34]|uniref:Acetolactate synthase large subunit n=1 Tax=Sphingobium cyanobacteriorum TaxID=3063954 RepID=A0ABT8ZLW1_9SPHN|nr:acetolactate synthase large subunit [Sphingobium sp. HBC34]MDO7835529.1 acetolactate synthase large subunit [Sphingobium sp. HBC34]